MRDPEPLNELLDQLEATLKQLHLWSDMPIEPQALASTLPFCCDTLSLQQWLQFVFLPKMHQLLERQLPLPTRMAILPFAQEAFAAQGEHVAPLLQVIAALDQFINAGQEHHAD